MSILNQNYMRVIKFPLSTLRAESRGKERVFWRLIWLQTYFISFQTWKCKCFLFVLLKQGAFLWGGIGKVHNCDAQLWTHSVGLASAVGWISFLFLFSDDGVIYCPHPVCFRERVSQWPHQSSSAVRSRWVSSSQCVRTQKKAASCGLSADKRTWNCLTMCLLWGN